MNQLETENTPKFEQFKNVQETNQLSFFKKMVAFLLTSKEQSSEIKEETPVKDKSFEIKQKNPLEDPAYLEISKKFDLYLKNEMYQFSFQLIENGYIPSNSQMKILNQGSLSKIIVDPVFLFDLLSVSTKISDDYFTTWLFNHYKFSGVDEQSIQLIEKKLQDKKYVTKIISEIQIELPAHTQNFLKKLYIEHELIGLIGNSKREDVTEYHKILSNQMFIIQTTKGLMDLEHALLFRTGLLDSKKMFEDRIQTISKKSGYSAYIPMNHEFLKTKHIEKHIEQIDNLIANQFNEEKKKIINNVKKLNTTLYLNNKIQHDVQQKTILIQEELPVEAKQILQTIHENYKIIDENRTEFDSSLNNLDNLYNKNLSEIISKYILIDVEYRTSLMNVQGKNATQLMLESLQYIDDAFANKIKEINIDRLSSLSVTGRHTKALKNNI